MRAKVVELVVLVGVAVAFLPSAEARSRKPVPEPAFPQAATVSAGGPNCVQTQAVPSASRVDVVNICSAPVSFYMCSKSVFQGIGSCENYEYSSYSLSANGRTFSPYTVQGRLVVSVRECPAGYRIGSGNLGGFPCVK